MRLSDTLTNSVRDLDPREPGRVSMYVCGPTVYDEPHLGHARSALTYDVLRRYLEWRGIEVHHVINVTDIDDKIIGRAQDEGVTEGEIAATYETVYFDALDRLGILHPHLRPHATEYVEQMVAFIAELVQRDAAYQTESGVYLRVEAVADYGGLVHRTPEELREGAGARVEVDDAKHDPLDFALWKAAKPGEPTWPSPWGEGRPGWHIECAAMSLDLLGEGFDIHGGGDDLAFPHHENERAEATAAGKQFAQLWVHNGMVNVSGEKMSKSLGNFTTITALLEHYDPRALRLLVLQTHYRKTMEINPEVMAQAEAALARLDAMARRAEAAGLDHESATAATAPLDEFTAAMEDDLGTPEAVAVVFETVRRANAALDAGGAEAAALVRTAMELAGALGLAVGVGRALSDDDAEIDALVEARAAARAAKDWDEADRLRDELAAQGVVIEDTADGTIWHRA